MSRRTPSLPDLFGFSAEPGHTAQRAQLVDLELSRDTAKDTDKAFCVRKTWMHDPVFLPKSLTELQGGVFTFPRWLAIEKGLL